MKFTYKDFTGFIRSLDGLKIQAIEEGIDTFGVVNIRHDVDDNIQASFEMALVERDFGIRSTYFVLDTAPYWGKPGTGKVISDIIKQKHFLGWHNNAITWHLLTGKQLKNCICEPLRVLRDVAPVVGTASHGDQLCYERGYLNYYAFRNTTIHPKFPNVYGEQRYFLSRFGLEYEAYFTGHTHYISDSGGNWQQDNEAVLKDFCKQLSKGKKVKLQILIHPQWWWL